MGTDTTTTRFEANVKKQKLQPRISARHGGKVSEETNEHIVKLCCKVETLLKNHHDKLVSHH